MPLHFALRMSRARFLNGLSREIVNDGSSAFTNSTKNIKMNRRNFLQLSAAGFAGVALSKFPGFAAELANPKKRVGLIGTGWYGKVDLLRLVQVAPVEVVSLCDVDKQLLAEAAEIVAARQLSKKTPRTYSDYRVMLKEKDLDIVLIATPDHWHALPMIAAVQAGAHVYVEKPIGHTVMEGRAMVNAARAAGRVVQVGTHRRVSPHNVSGRKFLREGNAGKIGMVRCFVQTAGGEETPRMNIAPPKGLNWDMWCGPAPLRPFIGDPESGKLLRREYRKPWVYPQA